MSTVPLRRALAIVMCCAVFLAWPGTSVGQEASPQALALPDVAASFGLVASSVPADGEGVWAMFAALPATVHGLETNPLVDSADRIRASWGAEDPVFGPPLTLQALSFRDGDFFPTDFTAEQYVTMAAADENAGVVGFGRDGDLVWIQAETMVGVEGDKPGTPEASMTLHTLSWGTLDGEWMFSAMASTPEGLEAVVIAYLEATA